MQQGPRNVLIPYPLPADRILMKAAVAVSADGYEGKDGHVAPLRKGSIAGAESAGTVEFDALFVRRERGLSRRTIPLPCR